jgi:hypothetical protein
MLMDKDVVVGRPCLAGGKDVPPKAASVERDEKPNHRAAERSIAVVCVMFLESNLIVETIPYVL